MLTIRAIDSRAGKGNMLLESELFYEQPRRGAGMSNHCSGHSMESMSKSSPACCCPPPAGPAPPAGLLPAALPAGDTPPGRTRHGGIGREDVGIGGEDVRIGGEDVVTLGLSGSNLGRPTEVNE